MPRSVPGPWSLGVVLLSERPEHRFLYEVLDHSGLAYTPAEDAGGIESCRVWLVVCEDKNGVPPNWRSAVLEHCEAGGGLVFMGNPLGLQDLLNVTLAEGANRRWPAWLGEVRGCGEGYLRLRNSAARWVIRTPGAPADAPLHFFGGYAVHTGSAASILGEVLDTHQRESRLAGAVQPAENVIGLYVDVAGTIRHITHGVPVLADNPGAPDGSAPTNDNILKAEDGLVLDWHFDRCDPCGAGFSFFCEPIADQWREVLLGAILRVAQAVRAPLRMLWFYPRGLKAIGHVSFDTDHNDPELARELLRVLDETSVKSTWFVIAPGYRESSGVAAAIKEGGHEIGFHFDAGILPDSRTSQWTYENFQSQLRRVADVCGVAGFRSNKNHYTRWQNQTDIPAWCACTGIAVDESKLASKPGTLGFFFGSSHPWFYHDLVGRQIDCMAIGSYSQDPIVTVPAESLMSLLRAANAHCGIASFTFHPAHIAKEGVADALRRLIAEGRELGLEWWRAEQISEWERARRDASFDGAGDILVAAAGKDAVVLELAPDGSFEYLGFRFAEA